LLIKITNIYFSGERLGNQSNMHTINWSKVSSERLQNFKLFKELDLFSFLLQKMKKASIGKRNQLKKLFIILNMKKKIINNLKLILARFNKTKEKWLLYNLIIKLKLLSRHKIWSKIYLKLMRVMFLNL
jgi:hypothetical protein